MSSNKSDHEYSMARSELATIEKAVKRLKSKMKGEGNIEAWVQSKITRAADYIDTAADYLESGEHDVEEAWKMPEKVDPNDIRKSKRSASVRALTQSPNPNEASVAQQKRKDPSLPSVRTGDTKIRNINAGYESPLVDKILQEIEEESEGLWKSIAKRRKAGKPRKKPGQEGYPKTLDIEEGLKQARKNVGASKCWSGYKAKGTKIKDGEEVPDCQKEDITIQDANGNTFTEIIDVVLPDPIISEEGKKKYCKKCKKMETRDECSYGPETWDKMTKDEVDEAVRIPAKTGNIVMVNLTWRGKYLGIKMFFPYTKIPTRSEVQSEIDKVYPGARVYSFSISEYKPGESLLQVSEDWQSENKKDKTDGMGRKAIKKYREENPDSKLKPAVTGDPEPGSSDAKRRASYCRRSKGQMDMHNIDCSDTPDKPICKARRRWKC